MPGNGSYIALATSLEAIFTAVLTGRLITSGNGRKSKEQLFSIFLFPASESYADHRNATLVSTGE
jgi:hypothetical protein